MYQIISFQPCRFGPLSERGVVGLPGACKPTPVLRKTSSMSSYFRIRDPLYGEPESLAPSTPANRVEVRGGSVPYDWIPGLDAGGC